MPDPQTDEVIAFRAPSELAKLVRAVAREEGISKSDVVRRAVLRDLKPSEAA